MSNLNTLWNTYAAAAGVLDQRPDFRFDPEFYRQDIVAQPDVSAEALLEHFQVFGAEEGRAPNFYKKLVAEAPQINQHLPALVTDPALAQAIADEEPDALELSFELIRLGAGVDDKISDFSMQGYLDWYPDIEKADMDPLMHYLRFAAKEGGRKTLADLRQNQHKGKVPFRPDRPTCLIAVHEMSRTGAPIVGRDLAKEASLTHNVIVAGLRGGELLETFCDIACEVVISDQPLREFAYFKGEIFDKIDFAITNSVECYLFAHLLVAREIPFAAYVHEYADYTFPVFKSTITTLFADLLIFSSDHVRQSWAGRLKDVEFDIERDTAIIPQRPVSRDALSDDDIAEARQRLSKIIGRDLEGVKLVCGAGHLQWRKGTDLFAIAAQISANKDPNTVFLWIGDGLSAEDMGFGVWMDYHLRQVGANTADGNLFFLPAGPDYMDVMAASDAMFMSSRIDPLPNVVFDAVRHGCQIVLFEGASGFCDQTYEDLGLFTKVEYANSAAAVDALLALPRKGSITASEEKSPFTEEAPNLFETLALSLRNRLADQTYFVRGESAFDLPVLFSTTERDRPLRIIEREKMMRYRRRLIWRDLDEARTTLANSDNWIHNACRITDYTAIARDYPTASLPDFSIHIHAHYTDELADDLRDRRAYHLAKRVLVTTDTETKAAEIDDIMRDAGVRADVHVVPNRGRDILPFMELFAKNGPAGKDEIWCHVHQKKSIGSAKDGDIWRRFLMRILLGDTEELSSALTLIAQPGVGLVSPFDPHHVPWYGSRKLLHKIEDKLEGPLPDNPLVFPVGNMFWARSSLVREMINLFGETYPWPNEPIANDGTEFHLIERLWPAMAAQCGLEAVFLHKHDERRV